MNNSRSYQLNCTDYVLHERGEPIGPLLPTVAMAISFDVEDGVWTLYKHGSPEGVHAWVDKQKKAQTTADGLADGIRILEGKLPLADLNRVLENNNHMTSLIQNCLALGDSDGPEQSTIKLDGIRLSENPTEVLALLKILRNSQQFGRISTNDNDVTDVVVKPRKAGP